MPVAINLLGLRLRGYRPHHQRKQELPLEIGHEKAPLHRPWDLLERK